MGFSGVFLLVFRGQRGQLGNFGGTNKECENAKKFVPVVPAGDKTRRNRNLKIKKKIRQLEG